MHFNKIKSMKNFTMILCMSIYGNIFSQNTKVNEIPIVQPTVTGTIVPTITKEIYAQSAGIQMAEEVKRMNMSQEHLELYLKSFTEHIRGTSKMTLNEALANLQKYSEEKRAMAKVDGINFLNENKKKPSVTTLPSGLQYEVMKSGVVGGPKPLFTDRVAAHYHGYLIDGKIFDSSVTKGVPLKIGVNQVIKGWTEALQMMTPGDKWKLFIPYELGYGERGSGGRIPPFSTLIFEVELLEINPQ
jgi:FKBP-type peptidyl-prolyl cis-trans isomerase FklB